MNDKLSRGELYKHLRHQSKPYRKRSGKNGYRGTIPCRVDIDERSSIVDEKTRLGDWEADTVIGKGHQGVLVIRSAAYEKLSGNAIKLLVLMQTHWRMYEPIAYSVS